MELGVGTLAWISAHHCTVLPHISCLCAERWLPLGWLQNDLETIVEPDYSFDENILNHAQLQQSAIVDAYTFYTAPQRPHAIPGRLLSGRMLTWATKDPNLSSAPHAYAQGGPTQHLS